MEEKEGLRWLSGSELTPHQHCIVELCSVIQHQGQKHMYVCMYAQQSDGWEEDCQTIDSGCAVSSLWKGLVVAVSGPKRIVVGSDQPWPDYYEPTNVCIRRIQGRIRYSPSPAQLPEV